MKWHYPEPKYAVEERTLAELWDDKRGVRLALIVRSDNWPEGDYIITLMETNKQHPWHLDPEEIEAKGTFIQAQELALALATLTN